MTRRGATRLGKGPGGNGKALGVAWYCHIVKHEGEIWELEQEVPQALVRSLDFP